MAIKNTKNRKYQFTNGGNTDSKKTKINKLKNKLKNVHNQNDSPEILFTNIYPIRICNNELKANGAMWRN